MQLILLERVEKLGQIGDIVTVRPGYGRNFLLPQRKAVRATKVNLERFQSMKLELEARNLESRKEADAVAAKLNGQQVVIIRQASEAGQLYGSVSARDIADAVGSAGFAITRNQVVMDRPVKSIGIFAFRIRLHPEVTAEIDVNVAQTSEEAQAQAARKARGEDVVVTLAAKSAKEEAEETSRQQKAAAKAQAERMAEGEGEAA